MKILIATKNKGKFGEIAGVLEGDVFGEGGEIVPVFLPDVIAGLAGDFDDSDFVEDGATHAENAYKKAKYYFDKIRGLGGAGVGGGTGTADFEFVLGEDSGIYVDALAGEMGVETRRWGAGIDASDEEWLEYFLKVMNEKCASEGDRLGDGVGLSRRGAKFVCNACLIGKVGVNGSEDGGEICEYFEGETLGKITDKKMAEILSGLPLSSVFLPDGFDRVYAALSREEKNAISHRGQAISKVKKFLGKYLDGTNLN